MASRTGELRTNSRLRGRQSLSKDHESPQPSSQKLPASEKSRTKTLLDHWVEPPLRNASSYKDHGGAAFGVLEHMQPLGEAPNAKVKARVRTDNPRKSLLGRGVAAVELEAQETPEGTPGPALDIQVDTQGRSHVHIMVDDERDDDYAPNAKDDGRPQRTRATKRKPQTIIIPPKKSTRQPYPPVQSPTQEPIQRLLSNRRLKQVVDEAQLQAIECNRRDLAAALQELWEATKTNDRILGLIEATVERATTTDEAAEFSHYFKLAKKRVKRKKTQDKQIVENKPTLLTLRAPRKPNGEPATSLSNKGRTDAKTQDVQNAITVGPSSDPAPLPKPRLSLKVKSPSKSSNPRLTALSSTIKVTTPKKKRSDSVGSDSSLTSLTSTGADGMDPNDTPPKETIDVKQVRTHIKVPKTLASGRPSLVPYSQAPKRNSADANVDVENRAAERHAKRIRLEEQVVRDTDYGESGLRRSLRESTTRAQHSKDESAELPELTPDRPHTRGLNRTPTKVGRAVSIDLDSPLSEVSAVSPSNPAGLPGWRAMPLPPAKRAKTKTSPEKRQTIDQTASAGAGGVEGASPIGEDDNDEELSENNDFCSACRGSGFLLCCDGCDRSFHFSCLDPPLHEDASELNEPWYCFVCVAKRPRSQDQSEKPLRGIFAPLLNTLRKRNPTNFSLPLELREYFEGVSMDKNGNFTDSVSTRTRNRGGYDDVPDYYRVKDAKGNTVMCHACFKTAVGKRPIITCDYCGEHWHLDCLDPPLANPPAHGSDGRKLHDWMCPLHVDHELRRVDTRLLNPSRLARKVHLRKPRNAKILDTALSRGFQNNGIIDILQDESDASESEFYDEEMPDSSVIYRMPSSGIKLDFIDKVKSTRIQQLQYERVTKATRGEIVAPSALEQANFSRRSILEQQLALNLTQFRNVDKDLNLGRDQLENLLGMLIAEAPVEVVEDMMAAEDAEQVRSSVAAIPPSPPSSEQPDVLSLKQRRGLEILQELIRRKLECCK